jgi:hypothetical protein
VAVGGHRDTFEDVSIDNVDARSWVGHPLHDAQDSKLGTIDTVYFHDESGEPVWVALGGSLLHANKTFVPVDGARLSKNGTLLVPYSKSTVRDAPEVQAVGGHLTPEEITTLQEHYHGRTETTPADSVEPRTLGQPFRGSSNESTFGSGQVGPGEPDDMTAQGTGHSDSEVWREPGGTAPTNQQERS